MTINKSKLTGVEKVYPLNVSPYEQYMGDFQNPSVVSKVNAMIQSLHQIGRLTNETVSQWNSVMKWIVEGGMDEIAETVTNEKVSVALEEVMRMLDVSLDNGLKELAENVTDKKVDELLENGQFESMVQTSLVELNEVVENKLDVFNLQLVDKVGGQRKLKPEEFSDDAMALVTGNGTVNLLSIPQDGSVSPNKTTFTPFVSHGKNLFNPNDVDVLVNTLLTTDGATTTNAAYNTSGFMKVNAGDKVFASKADISTIVVRAYGFYDNAKTWISGDVTTEWEKNPMVAPADGYLRVTYDNVKNEGYQVEVGDSKTVYVPYGEIYKLDDGLRVGFQSLNHDEGIFELKTASRNLFNPNAVDVTPKYRLSATGSLVSLASYNISGYIAVKAGDNVYVSKKTNTAPVVRGYGFYDTSKVWVSGSEDTLYNPTPAFTAPVDGFFRVVYNPSDFAEYQVEIGKGFTTYQPFEEKFFFDDVLGLQTSSVIGNTGFTVQKILGYWYNKKMVTNGDSITYGTTAETGNYAEQKPWVKFVSEELGMALDNFAIGGSTIAVKESTPNMRDPIVTRLSTMSDGDLIIIAGGSNDWQYDWTPLGDMANRSNFTFYGALHNLCKGLIEKYTGKQIMFMTPIKRGQLSQESVNANGKTLKEYGDIIKEVCSYYGIPVLDMYNNCIINPHITLEAERYIPDLVHPNRAGHEIMSKTVIGKIKTLA